MDAITLKNVDTGTTTSLHIKFYHVAHTRAHILHMLHAFMYSNYL